MIMVLSSVVGLFYSTPGLVTAVSFAIHLCLIRNNLKKLRRKKKTLGTNNYGSINQRRTHRTTAYTSYGISETCNTEYLPVSENEEDTRFLFRKSSENLLFFLISFKDVVYRVLLDVHHRICLILSIAHSLLCLCILYFILHVTTDSILPGL